MAAQSSELVYPSHEHYALSDNAHLADANAVKSVNAGSNVSSLLMGGQSNVSQSRSLKGSSLRVGHPAHFAWSDVGFTLSPKVIRGASKDPQVLKALKGYAKPGEIVAIMGASGSGKTSLLNVLSGRVVSMNGHVVTSKFTVNGHPTSSEELGPQIAYVMQEDTLCPTATPREALEFSAKLRLPPSVTEDERTRMVNDVITILHLDRCADTLIGDELIKGISGGEKRRTSIGVELITSPSILFLDEPTSGLDSFAAYNVVQALKDLAGLGCTVLCTIHQPSSEVFHLFDRTILLAEGRTLYDGRVDQMCDHFSKIGYPVPEETNPADHVMFLMQTLDKPVLKDLCMSYAAASDMFDPHMASHMEGGQLPRKLKREQAGWPTQLMALGKREVQTVLRNKGALVARFGSAIGLNLIFALIFYKVGNGNDIQSHFGALVFLAISAMFGAAQPVILTFPAERPRFVREYATGTYGAVPYFWSKLFTELPLGFLVALVVFLVTYWTEALKGNFILHVLIVWLVSVAASSTALFAGSIAANVKVATEALPAIFVPQILFAGFFIKIELIPVWIRWAQYTCSLKFGVNLIILNEFQRSCPPDQKAACDSLIAQSSVDPALWYVYVIILLAIFLGFRLLALWALTRRARGFALA